MRVQVDALPVSPNEGGEFSCRLRDPGIIRSFEWVKVGGLIAVAGKPQFEEKLVAFFETDPGNPLRNRDFMVLAPGGWIEPVDGYRAEYRGTAFSQVSGQLAHLYEIVAVD
jgi:hypothetical protein